MIVLLLAGACTSDTPSAPQQRDSTSSSASPTTTYATPSAGATLHQPIWLSVKYRAGPVDVADSRFRYLDGRSSSVVDAAYFDPGNEYLIVVLNGTPYHYCGVPVTIWDGFRDAESLGSYYNDWLRGTFDCLAGYVPDY